nr:hypothetical protein [Nostoc sp. ChiQUE02]
MASPERSKNLVAKAVKLARQLYQFLNHGDILLGDRAFCAYADIVAIKKNNCDAVFRKHQAR